MNNNGRYMGEPSTNLRVNIHQVRKYGYQTVVCRPQDIQPGTLFFLSPHLEPVMCTGVNADNEGNYYFQAVTGNNIRNDQQCVYHATVWTFPSNVMSQVRNQYFHGLADYYNGGYHN